MIRFFSELSPINFIVSPFMSIIVVLAAIFLAFIGKLLVPSRIFFENFSISGFGFLAIIYLILGFFVFAIKGKNSMIGRLANAFIIAGLFESVFWVFT